MADANDPAKLQQAFEAVRQAMKDIPANMPKDVTKLKDVHIAKMKAVIDASNAMTAAQFSKTHNIKSK